MTALQTYRAAAPILLAALVTVLFAPRSLLAAPADPRAEAKADLVKGMALMDQGDYGEALKAFEAAFALVPSPKIYFNMGIALQAMDRNAKAIENFERFLKEATDVPQDKRDQAEQYRHGLRSKVAAVTISVDAPGVEISVDGTSYGLSPLEKPVYVDPGSHQVVAQRSGLPSVVQKVVAAAGGSLAITVEFKAAPKPEATTSTHEPTAPLIAKPSEPETAKISSGVTRKWWFWTAVGAVILGGALTTLLATRPRSSVDCPRGFECPP